MRWQDRGKRLRLVVPRLPPSNDNSIVPTRRDFRCESKTIDPVFLKATAHTFPFDALAVKPLSCPRSLPFEGLHYFLTRANLVVQYTETADVKGFRSSRRRFVDIFPDKKYCAR